MFFLFCFLPGITYIRIIRSYHVKRLVENVQRGRRGVPVFVYARALSMPRLEAPQNMRYIFRTRRRVKAYLKTKEAFRGYAEIKALKVYHELANPWQNEAVDRSPFGGNATSAHLPGTTCRSRGRTCRTQPEARRIDKPREKTQIGIAKTKMK